MLSPCKCGGKKVLMGYCKTIFPCIHGWRCDKCATTGECYCAGKHTEEESFFDGLTEAWAVIIERIKLRRANDPIGGHC
jgi:hypothetical protein